MRHLCHLHHRLPLLFTHLLPTNMRTHPIHLAIHPRWDLPRRLHVCNLLLLMPLQRLLLVVKMCALLDGGLLCLV